MNESHQDDIKLISKPKPYVVIKDIQIHGFVGWMGDFGKSLDINDSVDGISVRHVLQNGKAKGSISDNTDFSFVKFEDITLKVYYDRKPSTDLNDDDIQVIIGCEGEPVFYIDNPYSGYRLVK